MRIMNLQPLFINIIFNCFDVLLKVVNIHIVIKRFALAIKYSKKSKKKIVYKFGLKCDKNGFYKVKKNEMQ